MASPDGYRGGAAGDVPALLYERHRAERAEAANRQLMFALRLAAEKIQRVQNRIQNSSAVMKVDRDEVKGTL